MKKLLIIALFLFNYCTSSSAQNSFFRLTDTSFATGNRLYSYNVRFKIGREMLDSTNLSFLDSLYNFLSVHPNINVDLIVHSDSRSCQTEIKMSRHLFYSRAKAMTKYLLGKGIDALRLTPKAYGYKQLLISDQEISKLKTKAEIEAAHSKNRRIEVYINKT